MTTKIPWTDETWNPVVGCTRCSLGCDNCYAAVMAKRQAGMARARRAKGENPGRSAHYEQVEDWNGIKLVSEALNDPLKWKKPRRIFVCSMSDLFHEDVPDEYIFALFGVMAMANHHSYQILTKRPNRMLDLLGNKAVSIARKVDDYKYAILAGRINEIFARERIEPISNWPGYFITTKGRVLSDRNNGGNRDLDVVRELKPQRGVEGHSRVMLQVKGVKKRPLVHRLVLEAFDRLPNAIEQCRHIDGNPTNNHLWNLKWGSQSDNWKDSKRHGTHRHYSKISAAEATEIRRRCQTGDSKFLVASTYGITDTQVRNIERGDQWKQEYTPEWPLHSVHLGVTVCNPDELWKIGALLQIPAAVHYLSVEPMLEEVDITRFGWIRSGRYFENDGREWPNQLNWVICGAETGPGKRPMQLDWARSLRDQCQAAGIPFFFKKDSNGNHTLDGVLHEEFPQGDFCV